MADKELKEIAVLRIEGDMGGLICAKDGYFQVFAHSSLPEDSYRIKLDKKNKSLTFCADESVEKDVLNLANSKLSGSRLTFGGNHITNIKAELKVPAKREAQDARKAKLDSTSIPYETYSKVVGEYDALQSRYTELEGKNASLVAENKRRAGIEDTLQEKLGESSKKYQSLEAQAKTREATLSTQITNLEERLAGSVLVAKSKPPRTYEEYQSTVETAGQELFSALSEQIAGAKSYTAEDRKKVEEAREILKGKEMIADKLDSLPGPTRQMLQEQYSAAETALADFNPIKIITKTFSEVEGESTYLALPVTHDVAEKNERGGELYELLINFATALQTGEKDVMSTLNQENWKQDHAKLPKNLGVKILGKDDYPFVAIRVDQRVSGLEKVFSEFIGRDAGIEYAGNIRSELPYSSVLEETLAPRVEQAEERSMPREEAEAGMPTFEMLYNQRKLSQIARNCLVRAGSHGKDYDYFRTPLSEFAANVTEEDLVSIRGFGKKSLAEVRATLAEHGLELISKKEWLPAHKAAEYIGRPEGSKTNPSVYIANLFIYKKGDLRRQMGKISDSRGRNREGWLYSKEDLDRIKREKQGGK